MAGLNAKTAGGRTNSSQIDPSKINEGSSCEEYPLSRWCIDCGFFFDPDYSPSLEVCAICAALRHEEEGQER